jgi:hypothetical protein
MKTEKEIFDIIDNSITVTTIQQIQNNKTPNALSMSLVKIIDELFGEKTNYIKYKHMLPRKAFMYTSREFSNGYIENVTCVCFINFYPYIMTKNKTEWSDKLDHPELFEVIEVCLNNRKHYKGTPLYNKIKIFINCLYGYLTSEKSDTINITKDYISQAGYNIMSDIMDKFKNNIISINTDEIYIKNFKEISSDFNYHMLSLELPFDMDFTDKSGVFFGNPKHRLIFDENNQILEPYSKYRIK